LVSLGPEDIWYKTPDFMGKPLEEVSAISRKMELEIIKVNAKDNETGIVKGQKPKPGYPIKRGDRLELIVSEK